MLINLNLVIVIVKHVLESEIIEAYQWVLFLTLKSHVWGSLIWQVLICEHAPVITELLFVAKTQMRLEQLAETGTIMKSTSILIKMKGNHY